MKLFDKDTFYHCKNVQLHEERISEKLIKARRKRSKPYYDSNTPKQSPSRDIRISGKKRDQVDRGFSIVSKLGM